MKQNYASQRVKMMEYLGQRCEFAPGLDVQFAFCSLILCSWHVLMF